MLSIIFGLSAALGWGAADFTGGLASRRTGAYRAVFYSEAIGLLFIILALLIIREPFPNLAPLGGAVFAGALGTTGLLLLFHAIERGKMSIATPVSALMAATLPVVVGTLLAGFPGLLTFLGFILSLSAIWMISREEGNHSRILAHINELRLPLLAGLGFGTYFILVHKAAQESTYWTMLASRIGGVLVMFVFMLARQKNWRVSRNAWPLIVLNGILDVTANGFYILASQFGRLDVAAILSSLYPAATVLLASILLKERVARSQAIGIGLALIAIIFLTI
ncbi:MAG: DMT family transporter [Anaerolineales bacterium]